MSVASVAIVWLVGTVLVLALAIGGAIVGWERYRPRRRAGPRIHPTDEVFIDPETGRRMRVWFDPDSGVREYRPD